MSGAASGAGVPNFFIQSFFFVRSNWIGILVFSGLPNYLGHAKLGSLENRTDSWWNACKGSAILKNQPFQCLLRVKWFRISAFGKFV